MVSYSTYQDRLLMCDVSLWTSAFNGFPCLGPADVNMGVDQKVLARSYVFGDHSSWLKSLRERSAMEFAKETYFFAKDSALNSWRPACALAYLQTPLPCREGDTQHLHLHY